MKEPSNIPAGKVKTNPRHIGKTRSVMHILNLKTWNTFFCGLAALRTWLAARRHAWLVALRAWLGDLVDAEHLEQLKHLKHLFCSDLDQKRAIFWSKSEMKHLKRNYSAMQ